jgi:hypothetical protein
VVESTPGFWSVNNAQLTCDEVVHGNETVIVIDDGGHGRDFCFGFAVVAAAAAAAAVAVALSIQSRVEFPFSDAKLCHMLG